MQFMQAKARAKTDVFSRLWRKVKQAMAHHFGGMPAPHCPRCSSERTAYVGTEVKDAAQDIHLVVWVCHACRRKFFTTMKGKPQNKRMADPKGGRNARA